MENEIEEQLLPCKAIAELLNVKESTVRKWVATDLIPYIRLGKTIRFRKTEVLTWINLNTINSATEKNEN